MFKIGFDFLYQPIKLKEGFILLINILCTLKIVSDISKKNILLLEKLEKLKVFEN